MPKDSEPRSRPTLRTLAQETGLSVAAVSRALKDAPDIGARTKERVREAARRAGYRPNRAGVRLRTGRASVISLLMAPERDLTGHNARLIHAFATALRETGFHLIVTPTFDDEDPLEQLRYLHETGSADAVVLNKIKPEDPRITFLERSGMAFVTHGRSALGIEHAWYDFDNERFARLAVDALAARGRRDLVVVSPPVDQSYAGHILAGAAAAGEQAGMRVSRLEGATTDGTGEAIEAAVSRRLKEGQVDAVLCASVASAVATVAAIENLGLEVGRDVAVAAKEPFAFLRRFRAPIVTVREDADAAGTFLARAALAAIETPDAPPMTHLEVPDARSLR